jgi:hypothetical protein
MSGPTVGHPLPRADEAFATPEKWTEWILADRGHGQEWARVFQAGPADAERIWSAIAAAVLDAPVSAIRQVPLGVTCEVRVKLTIGERTATVRSAWHYAILRMRHVWSRRSPRPNMHPMPATHEITLYDTVELTADVETAPAGARGGVVELLDGDKAMVEVTTMPAEPLLDRIVVVPLAKLRRVG